MKDMTSKLLRAFATILLSTTLVFSSASAAPLDTVYYFHNDHLGTPQVLSDASGKVAWQGHYRPFGEADITVAKVENNIRFPGQYFDADTGLHYNYFRDYDPGTGRYVQSDPIGLNGGINTYGYAYSSPANYTDRYGLNPALAACGLNPPACAGVGKLIVDGLTVVAGTAGLVCHALGYCSESSEEDTSDNESEWCPDPDSIPDLDWGDPSNPPVGADGQPWPWRGPDDPGGKRGAYVDPNNPGVSTHPDLNHSPPIGPHWDYTDRSKGKKGKVRIFPDGTIEPK